MSKTTLVNAPSKNSTKTNTKPKTGNSKPKVEDMKSDLKNEAVKQFAFALKTVKVDKAAELQRAAANQIRNRSTEHSKVYNQIADQYMTAIGEEVPFRNLVQFVWDNYQEVVTHFIAETDGKGKARTSEEKFDALSASIRGALASGRIVAGKATDKEEAAKEKRAFKATDKGKFLWIVK